MHSISTTVFTTTDIATTDIATTDIATDIATTYIATTDVATTDVATTDVATTDVATDEEIITTYSIGPENKNCIYEVGYYSKQISTGKSATILYTTCWRWGSFEVTVTEKEKEEILASNDVSINSHGGSCDQMEGGWFEEAELKNEMNYTDDEKTEILRSICDSQDSKNFNDCDQDTMEENGWVLDDTQYSIVSGCWLEE